MTEDTTILTIKQKLNKYYIYGDLKDDQYKIFKGGEQHNDGKKGEELIDYYTYDKRCY